MTAREIKDALEPAIFEAIDNHAPIEVTFKGETRQLRGVTLDTNNHSRLVVYLGDAGGFQYARNDIWLAYDEEVELWEQLEALVDRQRSEHE